MRYVVPDTDVASRVIKNQLGDPMAARLTAGVQRLAGVVPCFTQV
jgi:hypothetical protein